MVARPKIAVFYGEGFNTDLEMQRAFEKAFMDAGAERVQVLDMLSGRADIDDYQIGVLPGGFKDGDELGSGTIGAAQLRHAMRERIEEFLKKDTLLLGICNGFQILVKAGLLPYGNFKRSVTLTNNTSGKFEDRWVYLEPNPDSPCAFTRGIERMYLPVRHGEGKFYAPDEVLDELERNNQVALRYVGENGERGPPYPYNPNGSLRAIAGICDTTGRIFGMMPHPEAYVHPYLHPRWTRLKYEGRLPEEGDGLRIFRNAVEYFR